MPKQDPKTGYFICPFCEKSYKILTLATDCNEKHLLKYVPLNDEMMSRLLQFIYTKDESLLSDWLGQKIIKTLKQYLRVKSLDEM